MPRIIEPLRASGLVVNTEFFDHDFSWLETPGADSVLIDSAVQVIYTSGSTGAPKAIVHTYNSVTAFLNWAGTTFVFEPGHRVLAVSPLSFDLSVMDVFHTLAMHGVIVVPTEKELANSRALAQIISEFDINSMYATPSFFQLLAETGKLDRLRFNNIKFLLLAGEQLHWRLLHLLKAHFKSAGMFNLYGPSESNVCCWYPVNFKDEGRFTVVPIGMPCHGITTGLVPHASGLAELFISGDQLFAGYLGGQLEASGVSDHATGDAVEIVDGLMIFRRRTDRMLKRNGYRIEPAELENCISRLPGVGTVRAEMVNLNGKAKLAVLIQTSKNFSIMQIKQHCNKYLPHYFSPDLVKCVEHLPLNSNFKTDLRNLLEE